MTVKSLSDEDKLPIKQIIKAINKKMEEVIRVVDALNLGRTEIKPDGVYRTFNDGKRIKIAEGVFKKKRIKSKRIKLF
jgi:late competence protein required for DNA uptake (superfamily II DNA/RNA helicase)